MKLHVKSNATEISTESTPYIALALHFLQHDGEYFCVTLTWLPRKPTVFARLARWQLTTT